MQACCARLDETIPELADFKKRHEMCVGLNYGDLPGVDPRLLFSYSCCDSPLGAIVTVECQCGARWTWSDGESHEEPARRKRGANGEVADINALKAILAAARRPKMYLGPSNGNLWSSFLAFESGISQGLSIGRGETFSNTSAYCEVMQRLETRLRENDLAGVPSRGKSSGKPPEQAGDDLERIETWASELRCCIREEFPRIAEQLDGWLLEDESRPLDEC